MLWMMMMMMGMMSVSEYLLHNSNYCVAPLHFLINFLRVQRRFPIL